MCFLFFHNWSMWSDPVQIELIATDEVGFPLGPPYKAVRQVRRCGRCGKFQKRIVR